MDGNRDLDARALAVARASAASRAQSVKVAGDLVSVVLDVGGLDSAAAAQLQAQLRAALEAEPGVEAVRIITTADRAAEPAPLPQRKRPRILAVASGKGGVGKSTVSANLAIALARAGVRAGLLDADIHGPSVPTLMGLSERARLENERIMPIRAHGIQVLSMGLMTDPDRAVAWRGPMASSAFGQMVEQGNWDEVDLLVIDMPPGTGDITLTLAQKVKPDAVIIVSTPQDLALIDARRALNLFIELKTPVLGLVENMSVFCCPNCGFESRIFGEGSVDATAAAENLPVLARLPLLPAIRAASDAGVPSPAEPFDALARAVLNRLETMDAAQQR